MGNLSLAETTTVRPLGRVTVFDGIDSAKVSAARAAVLPVKATTATAIKRRKTGHRAAAIIAVVKCLTAARSAEARTAAAEPSRVPSTANGGAALARTAARGSRWTAT